MKNKEKGFKAPFDSMKVILTATEIMKAGDEKIVNLMDYAERLERERDQIAELAKCQQIDMQVLEKRLQDTEHEKTFAETRLNALQHAFKELMSSYETLKSRLIEEATIHAEEVHYLCQKANDEIEVWKKAKFEEKEQYLAMQKGFQNQVESNKIKFDNLVKRVIEVRRAQQAFFDKKKKVGSAPTELNKARALEDDLDNYLKQFNNNLFYTK
jgi:chromosome segregation ATPase